MQASGAATSRLTRRLINEQLANAWLERYNAKTHHYGAFYVLSTRQHSAVKPLLDATLALVFQRIYSYYLFKNAITTAKTNDLIQPG